MQSPSLCSIHHHGIGLGGTDEANTSFFCLNRCLRGKPTKNSLQNTHLKKRLLQTKPEPTFNTINVSSSPQTPCSPLQPPPHSLLPTPTYYLPAHRAGIEGLPSPGWPVAGVLALCYLGFVPARPSQASGRKMAWEDGAKLGCGLKSSRALAERVPHKSNQSFRWSWQHAVWG